MSKRSQCGSGTCAGRVGDNVPILFSPARGTTCSARARSSARSLRSRATTSPRRTAAEAARAPRYTFLASSRGQNDLQTAGFESRDTCGVTLVSAEYPRAAAAAPALPALILRPGRQYSIGNSSISGGCSKCGSFTAMDLCGRRTFRPRAIHVVATASTRPHVRRSGTHPNIPPLVWTAVAPCRCG